MKNFRHKIKVSLGIVLFCATSLFAQGPNCFLDDFAPKEATIPTSEVANKTTNSPTVMVTLSADTLGQISKYVFGNALAVWIGNVTGSSTFVELRILHATII
jgi:hypothetical protein